MKILNYFFLILFFSWHTALSQDRGVFKAKQDGRDIANEALGRAQSAVKQNLSRTSTENSNVGSIINYQGTNVSQKGFIDGNMADAAKTKINNKDFVVGGIVSKSFDKQKEFRVSYSDSFLNKAHNVQSNPESYINWLSANKPKDCKFELLDNAFIKEHIVCDEYHEIRNQQCSIGQIVEVSTKYKYQCLKNPEKFTKNCKRQLNVSFKEVVDCDAGIINWIDGCTFKTAYPYIYLIPSYGKMNISSRIGKYGGIPYDSVLSKTDGYLSSVTFEVSDMSLLKELTLEALEYYFPLEVKINGIIIFANPGNYPIKITGELLGIGNRELDLGFKYKHVPLTKLKDLEQAEIINRKVSTNITKFIKPGLNTIFFRSLVSKPIKATLTTKQNCKVEVEDWVENCEQIIGNS